MPSAESMDKMAAYGIAITQQPNFTYTLDGRYSEYLADRVYAELPSGCVYKGTVQRRDHLSWHAKSYA